MPILCSAGMGSLASLSPFQESLPHSLSILFCILCTVKVPPQTTPMALPWEQGTLAVALLFVTLLLSIFLPEAGWPLHRLPQVCGHSSSEDRISAWDT